MPSQPDKSPLHEWEIRTDRGARKVVDTLRGVHDDIEGLENALGATDTRVAVMGERMKHRVTYKVLGPILGVAAVAIIGCAWKVVTYYIDRQEAADKARQVAMQSALADHAAAEQADRVAFQKGVEGKLDTLASSVNTLATSTATLTGTLNGYIRASGGFAPRGFGAGYGSGAGGLGGVGSSTRRVIPSTSSPHTHNPAAPADASPPE